MIDTISIRNFKSLRDIRAGMERFTIFVGPNGSGKSSVLLALNAFCRICQQPQNFMGDSELQQALSRGALGPVEVTARVGGKCYRYRSQFAAPGGAGASQPALETAPEMDSAKWNSWRPVENQPVPVPKAVLLRLTAQNLMSPSFNQNDNASMAPDGTGLHAALASMALYEPETWLTFQNDLKGILPMIRRLRHGKMASGQVPPLQFDTVGGDALRADQMSEGSLLILGLLTALYAPDRPSLILLDDLDRGLHPKAQRDLIALLRRIMERNQELQLIATTHSPYLLNWVAPTEVRITGLHEDGSTVCAPLGTHPEFEKWKDEMAPGEMWSLFGEKWLMEKGAAS